MPQSWKNLPRSKFVDNGKGWYGQKQMMDFPGSYYTAVDLVSGV